MFFLKSYHYKFCGEASPRPFYKKIETEHISWSIVWNVVKFVLVECPSGGLQKYIKTKVLTTCFYLL